MKLLTGFLWLFVAAAAGAAEATLVAPSPVVDAGAPAPAATSLQPGLNPSKPDAPHIPEPEEGPIVREPKVTKCIRGCLNKHFGSAGCGSPTDWDCLCHKDHIAMEVYACYRKHCSWRGFLDESSWKGIEQVKCQSYDPKAEDPFRLEMDEDGI
ncbi:hypothetical protein QBC44DRAFT_308311 [Cladorrhinum sp. PSN332]|nr:hypothetical protein QBC44DRAFT_308311 [Cladorrhinum sp. PSN332]